MTYKVTKNQQKIFDAVIGMQKGTKKWPTYRELASYTGFPLSYVHGSVMSLVKKSKLTVTAKKHRSIRPFGGWRDWQAVAKKIRRG